MRLSYALGMSFLLLPVLAFLPLMGAHSESAAVQIDPPKLEEPAGQGLETAVLAGGCFWGVQAVYQHTKGVMNAVSGYAGGDKPRTRIIAASAPGEPATPRRCA